MMCPHSDHEIIFCFGAILTGSVVYGSAPNDGYGEHKTLCEMVKPNVLVASYRLHHEMHQLAKDILAAGGETVKIIWIDTSDSPLFYPDDTPEVPGLTGPDISASHSSSNNNNSDSGHQIYEDGVIIYYEDLLNYKHQDIGRIKDILEREIDPKQDGVFIMLTSGSTGQPKAVFQTHWSAVACAHSLMTNPRTRRNGGVRSQAVLEGPHVDISDRGQLWYLDENSVVSGDLPLDHAAGVTSMFVSMHSGCKFSLMQSYHTDTFWKNVSKYKITDCMASSTFAYRLLNRFKLQLEAGSDFYSKLDISSLRTLTCCGSRFGSVELAQWFIERYPSLSVRQGYGSTETGFISIMVRGETNLSTNYFSLSLIRNHLDLHSVGYLAPGLTAKLVDIDTGELLGTNQPGELCIKGPANFLKYYGGDDLFKQTEAVYDSERFYRTGDQVYIDDCERLHVIGRYKDTLYLDEDWKILPKELEDIVEQHPLVEQCRVVGMPDQELPGCHAPKAFVKLVHGARGYYRDETNTAKWVGCNPTILDHGTGDSDRKSDTGMVSDKEIFDFLANRVAKPKWLRGGVRFLEEWPRNGVLGKIDLKKLRQLD